jgi:hypothetical protein
MANKNPDLRKVTFNMFEADAKAMEACYGFGWTEKMRGVVHEHVVKNLRPKTKPTTIEEYMRRLSYGVSDD